MIGIRKAAYLAVFLAFARKTYGKLTFGAGKPGKLKEYVSIVPFMQDYIVMGSFDDLDEALNFSKFVPCFMATTVKRSSLENMEHSIRIVSIFGSDRIGYIINGDDRYERMREYSARNGQSLASTTM